MPFRDVIGHRRVVALLARAIHRESLPPSLIFAGPAGVGKRLTAVAAAQALNCMSPVAFGDDFKSEVSSLKSQGEPLSGQTSDFRLETSEGRDACGRCAACVRIARGVHPDVLIVEPGDTGSIKIEQIRDVIDRAGYRPFEGRRRAVIIDDADALVGPAQNALLKTLEEPPPSSVFILVTSSPDMLLPTVRSRCPRLQFRALKADDIATALIRQGHDETKAHAVAATADGSLGRALGIKAEDLVAAREIAQHVLAHAASTTDPRRRIEGAKDLLAKTGAGGAGDREQLGSHLRAMAMLLRDVEVLSTRADVRALANPDLRPTLERLAPAFQGERGVRAFTAIDQALVALDRNAGVKVVADWVMLHL